MPRSKNPKYELTPEQKTFIRENFKKEGYSLVNLINALFPDGTVKMQGQEARAVREFLVQEGLSYKTARTKESEMISFSDAQEEVIKELSSRGRNALTIAQEIFKDRKVKKLGVEHRAVTNWINENREVVLDTEIKLNTRQGKYTAPKSIGRMISKINSCTDAKLDEPKMTRIDHLYIDKLMTNLNNSRFITIANAFIKEDDRDLFEQEFIRFTWNKPDLTAEEVVQYQQLCRDIVNSETIHRHIQILNDEFENASDQNEMSVKLSTMIKEKEGALNSTNNRIEALIKKLNGERKARLDKMSTQTANFLAIVKAFQEEEERDLMVKMANMQRELVKDEAKKIQEMDELKARILGMHQDTLV